MSPKFDPNVSNSSKVSHGVGDGDDDEVGVEEVPVPIVNSFVVWAEEVKFPCSECRLMRKSEVLCGAAGTETKGDDVNEASSHSGRSGSYSG